MTQPKTLDPLPTAATFSKSPRMWGKDFELSDVLYGEGAQICGGDGRTYLDWVSALGANLLGYAKAADGSPQFRWLNEVQIRLNDGVAFSLPHRLEHTVACKLVELLGSRVPGWTPEGLGVRWGLSGSDACNMAIRLARAVTGRKRVLSSGYHGYLDAFVSVTPPAWGITQPQYVEDFDFFNQVSLLKALDDGEPVAAVIVEHPMPGHDREWYRIGYEALRNACTSHGALLIQDEVVTGFRWAPAGACEYYGITPDIATYSKALGNGVPVSAMVFRKEYGEWFFRNDPVFVSSTGFGNALSLAAADAVLDIWTQECVDHLWAIGKALMDGLRQAGYSVAGCPPRSLIQFSSNAERGYFIAGMRDRGILMNRPNLPNLAHSQADVELTVKAAREVKAEIDAMGPDGVAERMKGKEPMVLFQGR